jgi:hypothetical protein
MISMVRLGQCLDEEPCVLKDNNGMCTKQTDCPYQDDGDRWEKED